MLRTHLLSRLLIVALLMASLTSLHGVAGTESTSAADNDDVLLANLGLGDDSDDRTLRIGSPAFRNGGIIPELYTAAGKDVNPPLAILNVPENAASVVLVVLDPDAADDACTHWVLFDIPAQREIRIRSGEALGKQAKNDFGVTWYRGPKPPVGASHRYYFMVYALDTMLELSAGSSPADVKTAMRGHVLQKAAWMGRYMATR